MSTFYDHHSTLDYALPQGGSPGECRVKAMGFDRIGQGGIF